MKPDSLTITLNTEGCSIETIEQALKAMLNTNPLSLKCGTLAYGAIVCLLVQVHHSYSVAIGEPDRKYRDHF